MLTLNVHIQYSHIHNLVLYILDEYAGKDTKAVLLEINNKEQKLCRQLQNATITSNRHWRAEILDSLGDLFVHRTNYCTQTDDLVKACALYNAALMSCNEEQVALLNAKCTEVNRKFLTTYSKQDKVVIDKYVNIDHKQKHKRVLSKLRENLQTRIEKIEEVFMTFDDKSANAKKQEEWLVQEMMVVTKKLKQDFKELWQQILLTCRDGMGRAPCRHAVVALGSYASESITPYEALQYVILIEEGKQKKQEILTYFKNFCHFVHMKILALQESPLCSNGIKLFHDFYNKTLYCFPDSESMEGIHLDCSSYSVKLTPLGLKSNSMLKLNDKPIELMKSPKEMANLLNEQISLGPCIISQLLSFSLLEGDSGLVQEYEKIMDDILLQKVNEKTRKHLDIGLKLLATQLEHIDIPTQQICLGDQYICQTQLLTKELTMIPKLLQSVRLSHRMSAKSSWTVIDTLRNKLLISDDGQHNLKYACALSHLFALTRSLYYKGKTEQWLLKNKQVEHNEIEVNTDPKKLQEISEDVESSTEAPDEKFPNIQTHFVKTKKPQLLNHYYARLLPFVTILREAVNSGKRPVFTNSNLYKDGNVAKAHIAYRTLRFREAAEILKREAMTLQHLAMTGKPEALFMLYSTLGGINVRLKCDREAMRYFTYAIEIKEEIEDPQKRVRCFVTAWFHFGVVYNLRGKYEKAIKYYKEAMEMFLDKEMVDGDENEELCYKCHEALAMAYLNSYQYVEANNSLKRALTIRQSHHSNDIISEAEALIYYNMAYVHIKLSDHKSAITHLKTAMEIIMLLKGPNHISHLLSQICLLIGQSQKSFGKQPIADIYNFKCKEMMLSLLGDVDNFDDCIKKDDVVANQEILCGIKTLGQSYVACGAYVMASRCFQFYQQSLKTCFIDRIQHLELGRITCERASADYLNGDYETSITSIRWVLDSMKKVNKKKKSKHLLSQCKLVQGMCQVNMKEEDKGIENMEKAVQYLKAFYGRNVAHIELSTIYEELSRAHENLGTLPEAIEMLTHSLDVKNKLYGKVHPSIAHSLRGIGDLQSTLGDTAPALNCYLKALEMLKRLNSTNAPSEDIAQLLSLVGREYLSNSDIEHAEEYMTIALRMWRELCKEKNDYIALLSPINALGHFYRTQGNYEEAIGFHSESLEICNTHAAHEYRRVAEAASNIAQDYNSANLYADAAKMYDHAVSTKRRLVCSHDDKLEIATWLNCAGNMYENLGDHDRAAECHMESIELKKKALGRNVADEDVVKSLKQIASVHERRGNFTKALVLRKQSLQRQIQVNGSEPTDEIATSHAAIAFAYRKLNEFDNAYTSQMENLHILYKIHGKESKRVDIATSLNSVGHCLEGLGRYIEAIKYLEQSLAMSRAIHKTMTDHEDISLCMCDIGHAMNSAGNSEEATAVLEESVEAMRDVVKRTKRKDHLGKVLCKLGLAYESLPNYSKACEAHTESLKIWQDLHGDEPNEHTAESLRAVGRVYCSMEDYKNGITHLELAMAAFRDLYGEATARPELAYCLDELGHAYAMSSKVDKALNNQTRALHMFRQIFGSKKAHLHVAKNLGNLAETCHQAQQFEQAITHANDAINIYRQILQSNTDHPAIAALTFLLGNVYLDMEHYREAYSNFKLTSQMYLGLHNGNALHMEVMRPMKKMDQVQKILNAQ